jgi:molybdenum cofactor cytidylyltransferase
VKPRIAALVLAAGRSSRMPANKLLTALDGAAVIRRTVEAAVASRAEPVIVVTGHQSELVCTALTGLPITIVENVRYADGLSASLKCGVNSLPSDCDGFLVLLGDMPFVPTATLDVLIAAFDPDHGRDIIVPVQDGRRGNPVLWRASLASKFEALAGDKGAKQLMALHADLVYELEVGTDAIFTDLDTPEDFAAR